MSAPDAPATVSHGRPPTLERYSPSTPSDGSRRDFYDGRWPEPDYTSGSLRNWLVRKQRFFLRRLPRTPQARVLDLGCGGGWKLFTRAGQVVGIDFSCQSLTGARSLYYGTTAGDLASLPFQDESFDLVVSSDALGHIPLESKQQAIAEIYRVLKPLGRTLHYIEAEGDDPLSRFAKADLSLYQRYITGPEGHEGLEPPAVTFRRFRTAGFRPVRETGAYRMLMYVGRVVLLFDNEYARRSSLLHAVILLCKLMTRWRPAELAGNLAVALALEVTDRLLPESWASGVMVEYVK